MLIPGAKGRRGLSGPPHILALGVEVLDEALQEVHTLLHIDLIHLQQVLKAQGRVM